MAHEEHELADVFPHGAEDVPFVEEHADGECEVELEVLGAERAFPQAESTCEADARLLDGLEIGIFSLPFVWMLLNRRFLSLTYSPYELVIRDALEIVN